MSNINPRRNLQVTREKGIRVITQKIELLRVTVALGSALDRWVDVFSPSNRLSAAGEVFFEADSGDLNIGNGSYGPSTWVIFARARGVNLISNTLHRVDPAPDSILTVQQLPRSYEADSAVKILRFQTALNCPVTSIATPIPGRWYFRAYWEPNDSSITDDELEHLFNDCHAQLALVGT